MDVNSDGSLTIDEFFDELMAMPWPIAAGKVNIQKLHRDPFFGTE